MSGVIHTLVWFFYEHSDTQRNGQNVDYSVLFLRSQNGQHSSFLVQ